MFICWHLTEQNIPSDKNLECIIIILSRLYLPNYQLSLPKYKLSSQAHFPGILGLLQSFFIFPASFIGISFYCPCVSQGNKSYTNSSNLSCFLTCITIIIMYFFVQLSRLISIRSIRYIIIERIPNSLRDNLRNDPREQFNLLSSLSFKRQARHLCIRKNNYEDFTTQMDCLKLIGNFAKHNL